MTVPVKRLCQSLITERAEDFLLDIVCFSFLFSSARIYMVKGVCLQEWHPRGGRGSETQLQHSNLHRAFWDHACEPSRWPTAYPQRGSNHRFVFFWFLLLDSWTARASLWRDWERSLERVRGIWVTPSWCSQFLNNKAPSEHRQPFPPHTHADTQTTHLRHCFTFLKVQKKMSKLTT